MLLSKKTSIKVSREYANLIGHMCSPSPRSRSSSITPRASAMRSPCWAIRGVWHGETQIYNIGLADNDSLNRLTDGMHDYASLDRKSVV